MTPWLFATLLMTGSLFAMTGLRQFFIEPLTSTGTNTVWFVIQVLPLLLPLPGTLLRNLRSTFILCLVSTLYFVHGVLVVFDPSLRVFGAFEIFFALALCGTTTMLVRTIREDPQT